MDHLVFLTVREDASSEEVEDLVSSIRALRDEVPSTVDLSVGEDFSGRSGGYTHALFARFEDTAGLQEYMEHPRAPGRRREARRHHDGSHRRRLRVLDRWTPPTTKT